MTCCLALCWQIDPSIDLLFFVVHCHVCRAVTVADNNIPKNDPKDGSGVRSIIAAEADCEEVGHKDRSDIYLLLCNRM